MCCPNYEFKTERYDFFNTAGDASQGYFVSRLTGQFKAITVGPRSMVDRCYILRQTSLQPVPNAPTTTETLHRDHQSDIQMVSVERPFVGLIEAPILVLLPFNEESTGSAPGVALNLGGQTVLDRAVPPYLDLQFYRDIPPWLPTKRAPFSWAKRWTEFGTTGLSIAAPQIPGFGRRQASVSFEVSGYTTGTLTWRFQGENLVQVGGSSIRIDQDLQPTTAVSTNTQQVFFFDGEFDYYIFTIQETVTLGAGTTVDVIIKLWD